MAKNDPPVNYDLVLDILQATLPFSALDQGSLRRLSRACLIDFLPKGARLFLRDATTVDALFIIQKGGVKLFLAGEDGAENLIDYRGEGGSVGAMALFRDGRADRDAVAVEDTFVVKVPREAFFQAVREHPEVATYYLKTFSETFVDKVFSELRQRRTEQPDDTGLYLFSARVGQLVTRPPVAVEFGLPIRGAARTMVKEGVGSLLIRESSGNIQGIVTDKDLRKAVALGMNVEAPVETIMSTPLAAIDEHEVCFDALLKMMAKKIHHLAVTGPAGVLGVVTAHDILVLQGKSPLSLFREIQAQREPKGLYPLSGKAPQVIRTLVEEGAKAGHITRMITILNDLILQRLIDLVTAEIGPAPVPFCWMSMGSEGRREQTFATDQDNALVYADCSEDFLDRAAGVYFQAFSERLVGHLEKAGFPRCQGDMMASNPRWRKSLSAWKATFDDWMAVPEAEEVLHATIFFDFRGVAGRTELAEELRAHVTENAAKSGVFLRCLASDCLVTRPPLSFFKGFIVEKNGDQKNTLDLKKRGLVPFQDFGRVLALNHGVRETNTLVRLETLTKAGHIPPDLGREAHQAFEFLLHVRLVHQLELVERGLPPDNFLDPGKLSELEKRTLRDAFGVIGSMQSFLKDMYHLNIG